MQDQIEQLATQFAFHGVLALQATLILFFVVSPLMGMIIWRSTAKHYNRIMVLCFGVLITLLANIGINYLLRRLDSNKVMSDLAITVLSFIAAMALGIMLARGLAFFISPPGKPGWVIEMENIPDHELSPFDEKRRLHMARRYRKS